MNITWNRQVPISLIVAGFMIGVSISAGYIHIVPAIAIIIGLLHITITLRER